MLIDFNLFYHHSLEGMSIGCLLDGLHDALIYPEGHGADQGDEGRIRKHADHAKAGDGQKDDQTGPKYRARLLHITPIDQRFH